MCIIFIKSHFLGLKKRQVPYREIKGDKHKMRRQYPSNNGVGKLSLAMLFAMAVVGLFRFIRRLIIF